MRKGKFKPGTFLGLTLMHIVAIYAVWYGFAVGYSWKAWACFVVLFLASSLGISVGYHRQFTHHAFVCSNGVRKMLAAMGALAWQGPIYKWVHNHLQHHAHPDQPGDIHSPIEYPGKIPGKLGVLKGLSWAHIRWIYHEVSIPPGYQPADVSKDEITIWQRRWYWLFVLSGFVIPYLICGWEGLLLGGFGRMVYAWHVTWSTNSICHVFGTPIEGASRNPLKPDNSRNNIWICLLAWIGENWHGNHHAKPNHPYLGRKWWQLDLGSYLIVVLFWLKLAKNIRVA